MYISRLSLEVSFLFICIGATFRGLAVFYLCTGAVFRGGSELGDGRSR